MSGRSSPTPTPSRRAFADAVHTVDERYVQQRLIPMAMETRGVCAIPEPYGGDVTVYSSTQIPHILKIQLAVVLGIAEHRIRVVAPAVGGGFGSKLNVYAEEALPLAVALRLQRPVRWIEERTEATLATTHGRGMIQRIELAADAEGRITAVRARLLADMGVYLQLVTPGIPLLGAFVYHGTYDIPVYSFSCRAVFTNRTPTDAYRGAGRPEATYAIERAIDELASPVGVDPVEIRRRNFIAPDKFPFQTSAGLLYDSGNYAAALDRALELVGYDTVRAEQAARRARGEAKHLGIGISSYVEMCGLAPSRVLGQLNFGAGGWEHATVRVLPTGKVEVVTGTSPHGQGHETSWSMIAADLLGVPQDDVEVLHSDTAISHLGLDTYGSRSLSVGGMAVHSVCDKIVEKARAIAAHEMEVSPDDLEFSEGTFHVAGTPSRRSACRKRHSLRSPRTTCPRGWNPTSRPTRRTTPPISRSRSARTLRSSRWTRTREWSRSSASSRSTTAAFRSTLSSSKGRSKEASCRASRRPCGRKRATTRTGTCGRHR